MCCALSPVRQYRQYRMMMIYSLHFICLVLFLIFSFFAWHKMIRTKLRNCFILSFQGNSWTSINGMNVYFLLICANHYVWSGFVCVLYNVYGTLSWLKVFFFIDSNKNGKKSFEKFNFVIFNLNILFIPFYILRC